MFDDLMHDIVPDGAPGFNLGDVLLIGFTIVLALFTGFRSYDFISKTLPAGWELVAYTGLAVLDGGFIIWALAIALSATSAVQVAISWTMWLLDGLGLALVVVADTFFYTHAGAGTQALADTVSTLAAWAFPLMAILNAAAAILYKQFAPSVILSRRKRQKMAEVQHLAALGQLQAEYERLQAAVASDLTDQRARLAELRKAVVKKKAELDEIMRQTQMQALSAPTVFARQKSGASAATDAPAMAVANNGHQPNADNFTTLEGVSPFGE